jgi:hypothetical protein
LRAAKIGKKFGLNYILKATEMNLSALKKSKDQFKFIIQLTSLKRMMCLTNQTNQMELKDLLFWNQAPTNLKVLADNGVMALTTDKLKN